MFTAFLKPINVFFPLPFLKISNLIMNDMGVETHLDAVVPQDGLAVVQPVDIVDRMARDNALKLRILIDIHSLHLWLQVCRQRS